VKKALDENQGKKTISYEKVRYMVIFAKMIVEAVEADEARGESV
jgi:hypothetical protein